LIQLIRFKTEGNVRYFTKDISFSTNHVRLLQEQQLKVVDFALDFYILLSSHRWVNRVFSTDLQVEDSSMELGTGIIYIYVLKYMGSLSFLLFSQVVAPTDSCFLNNPEEIKGFRQTNHVG